ncbi:MAG: GNAT family N-acetyltransferase [Candidatus Rokuibacteriota bacterium]|nr:MAG: GNAT family N-acetyltransferase [Candidatus Rokubacteria bacterium]
MPDVAIRPAEPADADSIAVIYNQGIEDRLATLETETRSAEERGRWLAARGPRHPVIVGEAAGRIVGWASLNAFNPRPAYDHVADLSVYVGRDWRGRGVGHRLLAALIARGRELGYHKLVLATFPFNVAGISLYRRLGFAEVGVYREQGRLDGKWVDVVVMERIL